MKAVDFIMIFGILAMLASGYIVSGKSGFGWMLGFVGFFTLIFAPMFMDITRS